MAGVNYSAEDIIAYNQTTQQWSMVFDGSNVGLGDTDIDDFALLPNGIILLSVEKDMNLAGFGPVSNEDVLQFTPTSLGLNNTRGTFTLYKDMGSLGLGKNKIDGLAIGTVPPNLVPTGLQARGTLQDGVVELAGDDVDEPTLPDSSEPNDGDAVPANQIFLPLVTK